MHTNRAVICDLISFLIVNLVGHLECFVAVAEELHFGRAAERLGMAQPPLSQRIQRLEKELGVRLFDRSSRRVRLTPPGTLLLEDARDLLTRVDRIHALAERARFGDVGSLRAGVPADLGGSVVAALIAAFAQRRPDLPLDLRATGTADQVRGLVDGTLDVGVLRHPCQTRGLGLGPMLAQPVGVLLPASSPLATKPEVHLSDLAGHDLVLFPREDSPDSFDELLMACRRHGYEPAAVHQSPHQQFTLGLVLAGTAVALAPRDDDAPGTAWRRILGEPLICRTSCAWHLGHELDPAVADFSAVATEVLRAAVGMTPLGRAPARRLAPRPSSGFLA